MIVGVRMVGAADDANGLGLGVEADRLLLRRVDGIARLFQQFCR